MSALSRSAVLFLLALLPALCLMYPSCEEWGHNPYSNSSWFENFTCHVKLLGENQERTFFSAPEWPPCRCQVCLDLFFEGLLGPYGSCQDCVSLFCPPSDGCDKKMPKNLCGDL